MEVKRQSDSEQLKELGYASHFERTMSFWENFSLGFTYLSPVVGVYSVFAMAIRAGGPPMFWNYLLVGLGQLLVCLVFGEVVSQYPISGGIYPWAQRLVGPRFAWMAGWIYGWALFTTVAAVAVGGAPFLAQLFGIELSNGALALVAISMIALTTGMNLSGTRWLARVALFGFACELIGAILVGGYLLLFSRHQTLSILWDPSTLHLGVGTSYLPAFMASSVAAMFCYYGFEACGDVAEETPKASSVIPRAMRMTIYVGGGAASFVCLALLLAIPDLRAAVSGADKDPVATTLRSALGPVGFKTVIAVVMVSFLSCLLSLQAAASRLLFAFARDKRLFGPSNAFLAAIHKNTKVPSNSLLVTGLIPIAIAGLGYFMQDAVNTIISFASAGIYVAFQMVVGGAVYARTRGWKPKGSFQLGVWGWPVTLAALIYGVGAVVNMLWPRISPDAAAGPWYINYSMLFTTGVVIAAGLPVALFKKHQ